MNTKFDHIVIAANHLQEGVDYVREELGVEVPRGGEHTTRGTHNHVMNIGGSVFLEVVAPSTTLPVPDTPRWFGLDDPHVRHSLNASPRLLTWVVNTDDIQSLLTSATVQLGTPQIIKRGDLSWEFCLPSDGRLIAGGLLPYVMQWHSEPHPAQSMTDLGCRLDKLVIHHENTEWLNNTLVSMGVSEHISVVALQRNETPFLEASFETPIGARTLRSDLG